MTLQALSTKSDTPPISIFRQSQGWYFMSFNGLRLHRIKKTRKKMSRDCGDLYIKKIFFNFFLKQLKYKKISWRIKPQVSRYHLYFVPILL